MGVSSHDLRVLCILACLILLSPSASAWSNGGYSADPENPDYGTHDWIADMALTLQTRDVTFLTTTYHSLFLLGTEAPDNPDYIGDTTKHHVYFYASGILQDDICALRASQLYETALGYLLEGDDHSAAYDMGVMAHYVSDPGVFGHTMGAYTDWGAETHHSDYENEIDSMIGSLSPLTGISLGDSDAYNETMNLGEKTTFGSEAIESNVWMDTNYDWTNDTFVASAMASLYESVSSVAAVINHLMIEASYSPPPPARVPQPPASLTASVQDSHVVLTWTPPPSDGGADITSYVIYRGTSPENALYLTSVPGNIYSWDDVSVKKGTTYYYWVIAVNSVGSSEMIRGASATIPEESESLALPITMSAILGALATGGVLLWRRKARGRPQS